MKKSLIVISLTSIFLVACNKAETPKTEQQIPPATTAEVTSESAIDSEHTAENSLDWNGSYKGILPCADCEGIETKLELNSDKTFELEETYLGKGDGKSFESKGDGKSFESKGTFQFDNHNTSIIQLDQAGDNRKYFVAEGYLKALDLEGNEITGVLADQYQLKKEAE
ncbi:copper resistance protein NlpE [Acinetobacter sp. NIPH 2699]|uniref:copper resistance protein NlpE n=1 Tax=Acinetobacter sp. NIPH 2699 TaxID=2923433 RepID=UPI001F4B9DA2|nr:copper resistance protein NlpE [Acinetobacter sp. NIPH 2699]MCH7335947.1 copper resistance protein NlpE [Acinetobacter sp. NIPH 2699]